ncbi:hypothetical protein [Streptomyces sp. NPDC090298]|uniref:hypothetical protein n=1 Tax=Streptomyces sp. NPDC090298 TaxID=3365959 RepID=UPI003811E5D3
MSRALFVLRYRNGKPEPLDMKLVRGVLQPYIVAAGADLAEGVTIRTADGHEVDVDVNDVCVSVGRFPSGQFFALLAQLVDRLGATILSSDRPVVIREERDRAELSEDIREGAVVVATTGPALEAHFAGL